MLFKFIFVVLLIVSVTSSVFAQSPDSADSIWTRSRLTGDWWGARSFLANYGVTLDLEYTSTFQGLMAGAEDSTAGYGGKVNAFLNLESGKMGLWNGTGLHTHIEYRHGKAGANLGNTLFATNTAQFYPVDAPEKVVATSLYLSQRVGERIDFYLGKINPIDFLAVDPFLGGWGIHRFMNLVFVGPPSGLVSPVIMGIVAVIKTKSDRAHVLPATAANLFRGGTLTIMLFDPNDRTNDIFPGDWFRDGVNILATGAHSAKLAGRKATYTLFAYYSTAEGVDFSTLAPGVETTNKRGSYNFALQFTLNLQENPGQSKASWGFYCKASIADGNPNYVKASVIAGIGGRALFFGRPQDSFGMGGFYYNLSNELENALAPLTEFGNEAGIEAYYNWSITPWLYLGGDLQYVYPALAGESGLLGAVRLNVRL